MIDFFRTKTMERKGSRNERRKRKEGQNGNSRGKKVIRR